MPFRTKFILCMAVLASIVANAANDARLLYIEKYKSTAIREMQQNGIPASITLAQGCLESADGTSYLAKEANNHFGIKCAGWRGATVSRDDDAAGECFRKYASADESFRDHSAFLRYRDRYAFLFDLDPTDYRGWAYGLSRAGYATDPKYPEKLIAIIENYKLFRYDILEPEVQLPAPPANAPQAVEVKPEETVVRLKNLAGIDLTHPVYERYGVLYIVANGGETYFSLARDYNLFLKEILKINDESRNHVIESGTIVYLEPKRRQGTAEMPAHVVEEGETLKDLSQRFAIRQNSLRRINHISQGAEPQPGMLLLLKKPDRK